MTNARLTGYQMVGIRERDEGESSTTPSPGKWSDPTAKIPKRLSWQRALSLNSLSVNVTSLLVIAFVSFLHVGALLLFTRGFLLTRTTLDKRNLCNVQSLECTLPAKYERVIILLIDALRYDFLFPISPTSPDFDMTHHNHLTVPIRLSQNSPAHSLLYKGVADPPTTTLQRLKAITTGSLPTFIDAGSNFAGSAVEEDNWLEQANRAGKRIAFTGDDTWLTIFPGSIFAANRSFPFDSFNVEDLDTVDQGVRHHVDILMNETESTWDILLAHPLGLDHAGHRFGASHSETTRKLQEMDSLLELLVNRMKRKDLLIVLGDHGMDAKGDHGGDSPDETDAGLWMYSKTPLIPDTGFQSKPFLDSSSTLETLLTVSSANSVSDEFFSLNGIAHRSIPQISLVPTLSLLLGFPIPLNNLGTIIPELFLESEPVSWLGRPSAATSTKLMQALRINAAQIQSYVQEYTSHSAGSDLAPFAEELLGLYELARSMQTPEAAFLAYRHFTHTTLRHTRAIWAKFDPILMLAGLVALAGALAVLTRLYFLSQQPGSLRKTGHVRLAISRGVIGLAVGTGIGVFISLAQVLFELYVLAAGPSVIFFSCIVAETGVLTYRRSEPELLRRYAGPHPGSWLGITTLIAHLAIFASNSYTMWEDSVVLFLINLGPLLLLAQSFRVPSERLRKRIAGFSILFMLTNRLIGFSTICREEQHPYCTATFYGTSGTSIASPSAIIAATNLALSFPSIIGLYLDISRSRQGWASPLLRYSFRSLYIAGALYWGADYLENAGAGEYTLAYQTFKITIARVILLCSILLATTVWYSSALCIEVVQKEFSDQTGQKTTQVTITGFANSIGSSYLMLFMALIGPIYLLVQPIGQIVLVFGISGLLAILEAIDSTGDAALVRARLEAAVKKEQTAGESDHSVPYPNFLSVTSLVLLGFHLFFTTGHQAVLSSIQWKVAFVGFPRLTYPFSPILVLLNTLGPFILSAAAIPLLVFWNVTPSLKKGPALPLMTNLLNASLGFLLYHTAITLSSAIFASHLRRHLMVWKVFAPRFMLSAITLLAMDATILIISIGWGGIGTLRKVQKTFGSTWS